MYVVIQHEIKDRELFWKKSEQAERNGSPPAGTTNTHFFWSADDTRAVCVYQTDSVETLRSYVDDGLGAASDQTYFVVNQTVSAGLS